MGVILGFVGAVLGRLATCIPALEELKQTDRGHGTQHSPATGRGVAELIVAGRFASLDVSPLGWGRLLAGVPLVELNIL